MDVYIPGVINQMFKCSRRRHAGHITGTRIAFKIDTLINTTITSTA
jgi:hypothetical protein